MAIMKFLRVKEAAELLGVKAASIRQLERRGKLRAARDWNGHRRFPEVEILKLRKFLMGQCKSGYLLRVDDPRLKRQQRTDDRRSTTNGVTSIKIKKEVQLWQINDDPTADERK